MAGIEADVSARRATPIFENYDPQDVRDLIAGFPLAWVCPLDGDPSAATLLPLVGEYDEAGLLTHLIGHFSRRNPLYTLFRRSGRTMALFTGPQAYISPRDVGDRSWAPTWNYAQARIEMDVTVDLDFTEHALDVLLDAMEGRAAEPWQAAELGERYRGMVERIAGFRARVTRVEAKFKLGQDENPTIFERIVSSTADPAMRQWMQRFNPHRE